MTLKAGEQLGPYEIDARIGAGGMGEVYRAQDTRLHRTVAIKVVRPELALQEEFSARFRREALAISALNHPHVCSLYDIGDQNGLHYLVMEFVEGESLDQVLKHGVLPVDQVLRYGVEIADALQAAHARGIIHRDLKPANIMISESGVKVLDFGLAKKFEPQGADGDTTVTMAAHSSGRMVGTVAYMSPEQAEGRPLDARTDIFALGVTLYQMLCGQQPFRGDSTLSTLASILREDPKAPRSLRADIPVNLERIVLRCLAKKPDDRYASAAELADDLEQVRKPIATGITLRRPLVAALTIGLLIVLGTVGTRSYLHASRTRWAETVAIPQASQLLENSQPLAALKLLRAIEGYAPSSPELIRLKEDIAVLSSSIETTPPGAEIYATDYADPNAADFAHWEHLGRSPLNTNQLPREGFFRIRILMDGYEPVEVTTAVNRSLQVHLHTKEENPVGMVWIPFAPPAPLGAVGVQLPTVPIPAAWLDRFEVTNRQFKEFVNDGGYEKPEFWKQPFVKDGKTLTWERAMDGFRDAAGRQGPSTWEGSYPDGEADFPVGGVSWYEAAAYAEYAHRSLPTVYHWYMAAGIGITSQIIPWSNFGLKGPMPGGSTLGVGPYGNYDMAGNMKEWAMNNSGEKRFILGGGWSEPSYMFQQADIRSPWDREATFGFRCALYMPPVPETLSGTVEKVERNRSGVPPVDDRTFQEFVTTLSYEKSDLKVSAGPIIDTPLWRREDISFQAAYGNERVTLHLYLPRNAVPPYQAVFYSSGNNMRFAKSPDEVLTRLSEWIIRSGRVLVLPAYAGTLERRLTDPPGGRDMERDLGIQSFKDAARSIDYLETRKDIDTSKLAFAGISFGAGLGLKIVTAEPRFKAAVLLSLGYTPTGGYPVVDSWNYVPRVKIPVLMLNGQDDSLSPVETSQNPIFKALGTPEDHKKHIIYPGGHVDFINRQEVIQEALKWLNTYLGPVNSQR
jgi:eukaryotic-like serine/threonine-protein kinase